ncbi:MAG: DNA primase, partial [Candidatus Kapabacteria bacterium]|nr:DNA primase [Candidatus Kapabacteria bacterium]
MPFPEWVIEQVRQQVDLVELVGEVVLLKRVGKNYAGLCPFHREDTPSFFVQPERGIFKCFGCGKGGNAITFVMEYYRLAFPEAVRFLAERFGIALPEEAIKGGEKQGELARSVYQALQAAASYYHEALFRPEGTDALAYVTSRGLQESTLRRFGVGYAPETWDALLRYLHQRGFDEAVLEEAGLVNRSERGGVYDRFRHRLMFPIHDTIGRVVGFGARRLREEEATPKYLNSPATPVYDKGRLLYGLYHARDALRTNGYAVLVEGYMDVLTLHQAGIATAVATAGTALTVEQLRLLRRYCRQLFVIYDADRAGQQATLRALELALQEGFEVKITLLPEGEDPDSFVRAQGAKALRLRLDHSVP